MEKPRLREVPLVTKGAAKLPDANGHVLEPHRFVCGCGLNCVAETSVLQDSELTITKRPQCMCGSTQGLSCQQAASPSTTPPIL